MWIGEFGAFMDDHSCRDDWLQDAVGLFDKYQVGWTWWAFPEDGRPSIPNCLSLG
jgi:hypothetical protein